MKVIKDYGNGLRKVEYNHNDCDLLTKRFTIIKPDLLKRLCEWLKENKEVIRVSDCYDGASGWKGNNFFIGNADLSCNGYCLSESNVQMFLEGKKSIMWYTRWDEEYKELDNKKKIWN